MSAVNIILYSAIILVCGAVVFITLSLNTKSEGLGAAITGASDSYRGAVGVEEQKRTLLRNLAYTFMGLCLVFQLLATYM
jgi:preprotein translocase subunit SecG